jgi:hypothetical protein
MVSGRLSSGGGAPRDGANNSTSAPARIQPVTVRLWGSSWPSGLTPCGLPEGCKGFSACRISMIIRLSAGEPSPPDR